MATLTERQKEEQKSVISLAHAIDGEAHGLKSLTDIANPNTIDR